MDRFGMSLYDDLDTKQKSDQVAGWSSGIKLLQSQMQLKKATVTQVKRDATRRLNQTLLSSAEAKKRKEEDDADQSQISALPLFPNIPGPKPLLSNNNTNNHNSHIVNTTLSTATPSKEIKSGNDIGDPQLWDIEWNFEDEYSPFFPNDYDKAVRDLRDRRDKEKEKQDQERRKRRDERRNKENGGRKEESEEEEIPESKPSRAGVAIAPPPTLQDATSDITAKASSGPNHGASVAAKIMAKYGFKEGQGLGKKEQGIAVALQVEKTSKRGGRIIHEKDSHMHSLPSFEHSPQVRPPNVPSPPYQEMSPQQKSDVTITEIMKEPSKVVLLKNMVGPGEVDSDLEPEVKDECNTKYGDVVKVLIHELPNGVPEEAVRIFVEFKRLESAIKAVIDLNGRFFGGRQVKAGFYNQERFAAYQLLD